MTDFLYIVHKHKYNKQLHNYILSYNIYLIVYNEPTYNTFEMKQIYGLVGPAENNSVNLAIQTARYTLNKAYKFQTVITKTNHIKPHFLC